MPTSLLLPRVALILVALATVTPISGGYFACFLLLCWWVVRGRRGEPRTADWPEVSARFAYLMGPVHWGALALVASQVLSGLLGWWFSPYAQPLGKVLNVSSHMAAKWGLLWFVLTAGIKALCKQGWTPRELGRWLLLWLVVHFAYCLAQRWTGIDWTHGLSARLGPHRFAYGVYRVSGYMGHPLTLAYNLLLIGLASLSLATRLGAALTRRQRHTWAAISVVAVATLLISGSRFVLFVIPATILCLECGKDGRLRRWWRWLLPAFVLAAGVVWLEGSTLGRFKELFDGSQPLESRLPRLIFWQVHWHMFLDHPWNGVTLAGVDAALKDYWPSRDLAGEPMTAHHIFLQVMADSGVIGLGGLVALFVSLTVAAQRARKVYGEGTGIGYLVVATVLVGLMQNNLRDSEYLLAFWFFLALLLTVVALRGPRSLGP